MRVEVNNPFWLIIPAPMKRTLYWQDSVKAKIFSLSTLTRSPGLSSKMTTCWARLAK